MTARRRHVTQGRDVYDRIHCGEELAIELSRESAKEHGTIAKGDVLEGLVE
jgi:hypothetical protein